jgi:hypothetical protein
MMKNNYKTVSYVLFMSNDRLINYSAYCAACNVCSHQHQSFVQVAGELLQSQSKAEVHHTPKPVVRAAGIAGHPGPIPD